MVVKCIVVVVSLFLAWKATAQAVSGRQSPSKFMGREVTIIEPERDANDFPKGPASVCVEGLPQRQCYTAPRAYGNEPTVTVIPLEKGNLSLFILLRFFLIFVFCLFCSFVVIFFWLLREACLLQGDHRFRCGFISVGSRCGIALPLLG